MAEREEGLASIMGLLALIPAGKVTVSVGSRPLATLDADRKMLDLEVGGMEESGVRLSDLIKIRTGAGAALQESMRVSGTLSRLGWKLNLYADGDRVLSMGSGVSRLTGHISVSPRRLRKLLKSLG